MDSTTAQVLSVLAGVFLCIGIYALASIARAINSLMSHIRAINSTVNDMHELLKKQLDIHRDILTGTNALSIEQRKEHLARVAKVAEQVMEALRHAFNKRR